MKLPIKRTIFYLLLTLIVKYSNGQVANIQTNKINFSIETYIKEIQIADSSELGYLIIERANEWAAAGFIEEANKLLESVWKYHLVNPKETQFVLRNFKILWELSGKRPQNIREEIGTVEEIEQNNWDGLFSPIKWSSAYLSKFINKPWTELTGNDLLVLGIIMAYDNSTHNHMASLEKQNEALKAISKYINDETIAGRIPNLQGLSCAALLAASIGQTLKARAFIEQWGNIYMKSLSNKYTVQYLLGNKSTAKILMTKILAPIFVLDKNKCTEYLLKITSAIKLRMENGRTFVYKKLSLLQLLKRLSCTDNMMNDSSCPKWLGYAPANLNAILLAEKRLGVQLPNDYKEFLLTSNGFQAFSNIAPSFLAIENIDKLKIKDPQLVELWANPELLGDSATALAFANSILVAGFNDEQQILMIPPYKNIKDWTYWFFASWAAGETRYSSLRLYLESALLGLEKSAGK
jgi:hypothetical protein